MPFIVSQGRDGLSVALEFSLATTGDRCVQSPVRDSAVPDAPSGCSPWRPDGASCAAAHWTQLAIRKFVAKVQGRHERGGRPADRKLRHLQRVLHPALGKVPGPIATRRSSARWMPPSSQFARSSATRSSRPGPQLSTARWSAATRRWPPVRSRPLATLTWRPRITTASTCRAKGG